ncbi:MAG: hypothetical protein QXQ94_11445 [Candidatus Bathyarchaeia archaeon]
MKYGSKKLICASPSPYSNGLSLASQKVILDMVRFSSDFSFEPIFLGQRNSVSGIVQYYLTMIMAWHKADVILTIYPYICMNLRRNYLFRKLESLLINRLNRHAFSILYVVDLPIERSVVDGALSDEEYRGACEIERHVFKSFDVLLVFNEDMKREICDKYNFSDDKFVLFEVLDYGADIIPRKNFNFEKPLRVAFLTSNLNQERSSWISEIPSSENVTYSFFGINGEWINGLNRKDIKYEGVIPPAKAPGILEKFHFGIIYYNLALENYLKYGSTSKFSAYMAANLPVLCPSKLSYLSSLIHKYGVGICYDSLNDIPKCLESIDKKLYGKIKENCAKLGEKVRHGYFIKKALKIALQKTGLT